MIEQRPPSQKEPNELEESLRRHEMWKLKLGIKWVIIFFHRNHHLLCGNNANDI
ncbi:MAG: hypothetical protein DDT31_01606 [Syntrophomonadaceae bacterium]|nr:hypothetical protein [Bacillota bacterium]